MWSWKWLSEPHKHITHIYEGIQSHEQTDMQYIPSTIRKWVNIIRTQEMSTNAGADKSLGFYVN